jgi:hypothetical protein
VNSPPKRMATRENLGGQEKTVLGRIGHVNNSASPPPAQRAPRLNVRRVRQAAEQAQALVDQLDRDTWPNNPRYHTIRYVSTVLAEAIELLDDYEADLHREFEERAP